MKVVGVTYFRDYTSSSRKEFIESLEVCFDTSDLRNQPLWFDIAIVASCCECYQLIKNSPSVSFSDGYYFLGAVYILIVLSEQEVTSLAFELSRYKKLSLQLFSLLHDDKYLDYFIQRYSKVKKITKSEIKSKFRILEFYRCVIFPDPAEDSQTEPLVSTRSHL